MCQLCESECETDSVVGRVICSKCGQVVCANTSNNLVPPGPLWDVNSECQDCYDESQDEAG